MKKATIVLMLLLAAQAYAAPIGMLEKDKNGNVVQGAAPNGELSQSLTEASTTIDMSSRLWWGLYAPTACKVRLMPTSAKGDYPQFSAPANTLTSRYVNKATPFANFSGCASGELQGQ